MRPKAFNWGLSCLNGVFSRHTSDRAVSHYKTISAMHYPSINVDVLSLSPFVL